MLRLVCGYVVAGLTIGLAADGIAGEAGGEIWSDLADIPGGTFTMGDPEGDMQKAPAPMAAESSKA